MSNKLTPQELNVINLLRDAWNAFSKLDGHHPSDCNEFVRHINANQNSVMARLAARLHPHNFPNYGRKEDIETNNEK